MASLTEIREGMAAALDLDGFQVSPWLLSNPTPPAVMVFPSEIEYDSAMSRGHDDWLLTVQAMVGLASDIGAQQRLDELLAPSGPSSVKDLLEPAPGQPALGGIVDDIRVESCTGYRVYVRTGGDAAIGAEWSVRVLE